MNEKKMLDFTEKQLATTGEWLNIPVIILIVVCILVLKSAIYTIETGFVGVKARFGRYFMDEVEPGIHFKIPLADTIKKVDVRIKTINYVSSKAGKKLSGKSGILYGQPIPVLDKRGLRVQVELTVQYQLRPEMAAEVIANYGMDWELKLIHPIVRDSVRDVIAKYPAEEIPMKRTEIAQNISNAIVETVLKIKGNPLQVTAVQLRDIDLPPRIAQKIQEVQEAKQEADKMKALEEKARYEQQVRLIKAETEKKEKILRAEAEKEEKILKAQGEAEANKLLSKSITPELLKWRELDIQEKMAEAIRQNPHVRLFYGNSSFGNLHFWLEEKSKEDK